MKSELSMKLFSLLSRDGVELIWWEPKLLEDSYVSRTTSSKRS